MQRKNVELSPATFSMLPVDLEMQMEFAVQVEQVIKTFRMYRPDIFTTQKLMHEPHDFVIDENYGANILVDIAERFQAGITQRLRANSVLFMSFIKMVYMMLTEKQKLSCSKRIIDEWQRMASRTQDHSSYFEKISTDFDKHLEDAINIVYNAEDPESQVECVENEIRWALTISSVKTVHRMLYACIHNPKSIPATLKLLDLLPDLFYNRELIMWHRDTEIDVQEPLLIVVLRRIIFDARSYSDKNETWEAIDQLTISLTSPPDGKRPLLGRHYLLDMVLDELYSKNRTPMKSVEILTRIAARIFSSDISDDFFKRSAGSMRDQAGESMFLMPTIVDFVIDYLAEYEGKSKKITTNLKSILRSIGERMQKVKIVFDTETRDYFFNKPMAWYIKFYFTKWFVSALGVVSEDVPLAIFHDLSKDEVLEGKEHRGGDHFLIAVVKLGLFDVEGALEVINSEHGVDFRKIDVVARIVKTMWGSFEERGMGGVDRVEMSEFLKELFCRVNGLGPQTEIDFRGLLKCIPEDETAEKPIVNVPFNQQVKSEKVQALKEPHKVPWPTDYSFPALKPMSWKKVRSYHRDAAKSEAEIQRKVNEKRDQMAEELRQKWIAEGLIGGDPRNHWTNRYETQSESTDFIEND